MSIFDDLDNANVFENSKYFQPGMYIAEIVGVKFIQAGYKGDSFVIEAKVVGVKSTHPEAPAVGELCAQVWNASGEKRDIARATWMGFLCAVFGVKQEQYTAAQWKQISSQVIDGGALNGKRFALEVFTKKTRTGGDFTYHKWLGAATAEQLAEFGIAA